ncbi:MAG: BON domain-containing protein [Pirellulaceae bacterium]|nr:BON domain-containing protein [Pirellulaceae bacterium]
MQSSLYTPFKLGAMINQLFRSASMYDVYCQCTGSLVVLRGKVGSSTAKQRAASIARKCCGMGEISNEIHIVG